MTKFGYAPSPHEWSPRQVEPPTTFENIDLYPAVSIIATRRKVGNFGDVVEREDELGVCLVAHFAVHDTLVTFYQSALDSKDHWTVFVDMRSCVASQQVPTLLGRSVVRYLAGGSIEPEWVNSEADTEYRSRRRKPSQVVAKRTAPRTTTHSFSKPRKSHSFHEVANDARMVAVARKQAGAKPGRYLIAEKAAAAQKSAAKQGAAPAKKAAAVRKTATAKKGAAKRAAAAKK
ncbi:hypothetical protein [Burkholderia pseudomallei]|uniref:hypothetical protein n=1 Tax=Burkholderia pseudomallei TaxID=28450 RepID=UPI0005E0EF0A|nr:hypothetical protein [Burkholderia pseudomallei]CPH74323.1 Uncharacterised protein [Burkholderia pseudomallei]